MAATDLALRDDDDIPEGDDVGLTDRQVSALEWLNARGLEPAKEDLVTGKFQYDPDPQVRAYQMIFQGRFGGRQVGAGRPRAAQSLGEYIRNSLQPKLRKALDRALDEKEGAKINLEALKVAVDIERGEAKLRLEEDKQDIDEMGKEELVGTLFALLADQQTAGVIEAAFESIPDAEVVSNGDSRASRTIEARGSLAQGVEATADLASAPATRAHSRRRGGNGREGATGDRTPRPNPYAQAAKRRTAERRRAS